MKTVQLILGPAGAGKSTYCSTMLSHAISIRRSLHLVNLDPAAEVGERTIDIKDLVTVEEVQSELGFGPNGGLVYALEYLIENLDWLEEQLGEFDDDNLIVDCPGQIEIYTHQTIMKSIVDFFVRKEYRVCVVYLLDSQFIQDTNKFFAGVMSAMSAMLMLAMPQVNVLSKMDLLGDGGKDIERFLTVDSSLLEEADRVKPKFAALNQAIVRLIDEFGCVNFVPLDVSDEYSIAYVLSHVDNAIQFGEDDEPKEARDADFDPDEN